MSYLSVGYFSYLKELVVVRPPYGAVVVMIYPGLSLLQFGFVFKIPGVVRVTFF